MHGIILLWLCSFLCILWVFKHRSLNICFIHVWYSDIYKVAADNVLNNQSKRILIFTHMSVSSLNLSLYCIFSQLCPTKKTLIKFISNIDYQQKHGFRLWIDTDDMKGSTLEAMSDAVENAWAVIMCLSEYYRESPDCRTGSYLYYSNVYHIFQFVLKLFKYYTVCHHCKPDDMLTF